ncbi:MAG TPA: galactokinase [Acidisarcina sp.]
MQSVSGIKSTHREQFQAEGAVFVAPGRVNLIGEHTDYSEGFVMPAAIEFATLAAVSARSDNQVVIYSQNFDERVEYDAGEVPVTGRHHWTDYPLGVLTILRRSGIEVPPFSLTINGDVPLGSGLSSSASLEVATMLALLSLTSAIFPLQEIARLCQRVENEYVGAQSGIMDQFVSCCGAAGHALLLDCRDLAFRLAPIPEHVSIVICNTMVKHSIAGGDYNTRRAEIEAGADIIRQHRPEVRVMRDVTVEDLARWGSEMPANVLKRCRHVVTENLRTVGAADALESGDLKTLGRLMAEAHASYRDDFEASCKEADILVELAAKQRGLIGARLTGGGFGGCTVNLVEAPEAGQFADAMKNGYLEATGIQSEVYLTKASAGAHAI